MQSPYGRDQGAPGEGFLNAFQRVHGRRPRILHVGNIANNAYLNAKILNRYGFDCDVVCADYYHIMGCPEWEDVDFTGAITDHFRPDWTSINLHGYERPRWFAQGPRELCVDYLIAKRTGQTERADVLWRQLGWANKTLPTRDTGGSRGAGDRLQRLRHAVATLRRLTTRARHYPGAYAAASRKVREWGRSQPALARTAVPLLMAMAATFVAIARASSPVSRRLSALRAGKAWDVEWPARFKRTFPDRPDQLSAEDCANFIWTLPDWERLFMHYDIVQAYAADVMFPMFAEKRPYIGFEHGTLRVFTLADNALSRLTALGYNRADHVLITNGDCLTYAEKIKVKSFTPMIHPFDDALMQSIPADPALRRQHGVSRIFVCPLRHDWEIKGTDKYIRALPRIVERIGRDFRVIMTAWGTQVGESADLARTLGVEDLIVWREPFNRVELIRHLKSADVVFDQIALPCFGGTAPQAIGCGVPVIMSYDPSSTAWLIPEPAPILTAWSVEDIVSAVVTALDRNWRDGYQPTASRWYSTYHSAEEVVRKHAAVYRRVCQDTGLLAEARASRDLLPQEM